MNPSNRDKYNYSNAAQQAMAQMPDAKAAMEACAGRQSSKSLLLDHVDKLRRKANQLEALAYAIENIHGEPEVTLYGLLSGDLYRT